MFKGLRFSAVDSLIPVTLAFCTGIIWGNFATIPVTISLIVIILLAIRLASLRNNSTLTSLILLAFFFMIGGVHATLFQRSTNPTDIANQITSHQQATIIGTILRMPTHRSGKTSLLIASEQLITAKFKRNVSGKILLSMPGTPPANLKPGTHFMVLTQLSPVKSYGVPGAFDYKSYLNYQGIKITGWINSPAAIKKLRKIPADGLTTRLQNIPEKIRQVISRQLDKSVPHEAGIYKALLIGDRTGLSPEILEAFKACGIVHLLAISGIHMGLLALTITFFITWILKRSQWTLLNIPITKTAALFSLPPLFFYALVAGFNPPAVRALIMVAVFIGALLVNRQWSIINNTAIAALVILSINPALLFTASFELSFAAILSMAMFLPVISVLIKKPPTPPGHNPKIGMRFIRWCLFSIIVSLTAIAGTAPILIYHFNRISLISPLTTLIIEPLLCLWSLMWGLIASLALPSATLSSLFFKIGAIGISLAIKITSFIAVWPVSIWLPSPSIVQIILYFAALILFSVYLNKRNKITLILFALLSICLLLPQPESQNKNTEVDIINVGHGCATILQLPGKHTIIIDGGKRQNGRHSTFNAGKNLIAPFLWHRQISNIDAIIITHPHADHYNGLPFIIKRFKPKTIWINSDETTFAPGESVARLRPHADDYERMSGFRDLIILARQLGIKVKIPATGELLYRDGAVKLTIIANLHNNDTGKTPKKSDQQLDSKRNNQGLVIRLEDNKRSFLFTGDIELQAEQRLIAKFKNSLRADVLTVPHHGSHTSSSQEFIKAVAPRCAIISAEANGHGVFPAPEVIDRYKQIGAKIINTAISGSIFFTTDGDNLQTYTYQSSKDIINFFN